jgi:HAD superfamily hydrolase (TIGR01509 family)
MNRLVIFDLDGVLVDSKQIHYESLNLALATISDRYVISEHDQKNIYEGLPTKNKLAILTKRTGLPQEFYSEISSLKQTFTTERFSDLQQDKQLISFISKIKSAGINVAVASNSIRSTIDICLAKLGISELIDFIVSNEDVSFPKPHPEIYWKAMSHFGYIPDDVVIFEDSIVGRISAMDSGATLIPVKDRQDLTEDKIDKAVGLLLNKKGSWKGSNINVLIPMAGAGSRFAEAGYVFPKPLIDVNNKPMIQAVVDNLAISATYTYIVQREHYEKYNLGYLLNAITPDCNIVQVDGLTEGAAVTCLMAKEFINSEDPLVMANSDQIVDWDSREFIYDMNSKNADGGIVTFKSTHPKWSYAKVDEFGLVTEVAEKKPISDNATVGIYYWKRGSDFVKYAEQMIKKDIRVNGEFYTCPVFNEAIQDGKRIYTSEATKMWGIGTPEDLDSYLRSFR